MGILRRITMEVVKSVIDSLRSDAEKELQYEFTEKAKIRIKDKMHQLKTARQIVKNTERELEDLYVELQQSEQL
jgi:hypothetical protein